MRAEKKNRRRTEKEQKIHPFTVHPIYTFHYGNKDDQALFGDDNGGK